MTTRVATRLAALTVIAVLALPGGVTAQQHTTAASPYLSLLRAAQSLPRIAQPDALASRSAMLTRSAGAVVIPPDIDVAAGRIFTVTSTKDAPAVMPIDGHCRSTLPTGACTVRAAIQVANGLPGGSAVLINVPAGIYQLTLGTLALTANRISISGALSSTTIISGFNSSPVLTISSAAQTTLSQITLTGGNGGYVYGGGIVNQGVAVLRQSAITGSAALNGGGIFNDSSGRLWLIDSAVSGDVAVNGNGGGIDNAGTMMVFTSTLRGNSAYIGGGGIDNEGTMTMFRVSLSGNSAYSGYNPIGAGGGIDNIGTLTVNDSDLSGNSAYGGGYGGGISNEGTLTIDNSTLRSNIASGEYTSSAGGIYSSGLMTVNDSTLSGNSPGGALGDCNGTVTFNNSTLSGNAAYGIGNCGLLTIDNSTLSGNSGEGIFSDSALTLRGTIVANTTSGVNCSLLSPINDSGYNLDSDGSCGLSQTTDLTATDPLQYNGGPTQTMALQAGSLAIDHGGTAASGCPPTDQRGLPRPDEAGDNGACDMGAYESQGIG